MTLVVDANVVVKWYADETDSEQARQLLESDELLLAPTHVAGEVGHVLIRQFRDGKIEREQIDEARVGLANTVVLIPLEGLFELAVIIALETGQSFYDALYVAAAVQRRGAVVTSDARLSRALRPSRWSDRVILLQDWAGTRTGP